MPRGHVIVIASAAAPFALAVLACGLTADFSGLTGGTQDAGGADATVDSSADVGADVVRDAGADAAPDACTAQASYCESLSPQPIFCSDFDKCDFPMPVPWANYIHTGTARLSLDSMSFRSPPRSLLAADSMEPQQTDIADLRQTLPSPPPSTLIFAFSIELVSLQGVPPTLVVVAAIDFIDAPDAGASNHLQFTLHRNGTTYSLSLDELSAGCSPPGGYLSHDLGGVQQNRWTDVRLTVKRSGPAPTGSVSFTTTSGTTTTALPDTQLCANVGASQVGIAIGSIYKDQPTTTAWLNRFDNVWFDVTPGL